MKGCVHTLENVNSRTKHIESLSIRLDGMKYN